MEEKERTSVQACAHMMSALLEQCAPRPASPRPVKHRQRAKGGACVDGDAQALLLRSGVLSLLFLA